MREGSDSECVDCGSLMVRRSDGEGWTCQACAARRTRTIVAERFAVPFKVKPENRIANPAAEARRLLAQART